MEKQGKGLSSNQNSKKLIRAIKGKSGLLIALAALLLIFGALTKFRFLEGPNLINLVRSVSLYSPIAFGMTLCLIVGGIDLSVGALCAVASTYCAGLIADFGMNYGLACLIGILMATLMGSISGFIISRTKIPPFIVTLSMMQIGRGLAYMYSGGRAIRTPTNFGVLGNGYLFNAIPYPVIIMVVVMIFLMILLNKSKFGRNLYAIGGNREAARYSGIDVKRTESSVYIISGVLSGICGVVWASRTYSGQPTLGNGAEMDAIASAIVGGTSMSGGIGTITGTLIGAFIIQTLSSGLNYLNIPFYFQFVVQGTVILVAVFIDIKRKEHELKSKK